MTVKRCPLDFYCFFLGMGFVLTCLKTAKVHAETCCIHVRLTNRVKTNLCCVRLNKCGLFSNKYNGMCSLKIGVMKYAASV